MGRWAVTALRVIIAVSLVGSLVVQVVLVAALWLGEDDAPSGTRVALVVIGVAGVACLQVIGLCIWRLLTMVRRDTVFSGRAFRYVDAVVGALSTGALLVLAIAVVARFANHSTPGDAVAPGLVGLICGLSLVVAGVALVVFVMRALLAQAVSLDTETKHLKSELSQVI